VEVAIEIRDGSEPIARQWDALAERTGATPFVRPGWIDAWHRAFGRGRLELITARRGGDLVGVLPLVRRRGALASAANWHSPLFDVVFDGGGVVEPIAEAALSRSGRLLDITLVDSSSPLLDRLSELAEAASMATVRRVVGRAPFIEIDSDWSAFESSLPARRLSKYRRFRRRLDEQGEVWLGIEPNLAGLERLLAEAFRIEALGWKGRAGTAIVSRPETLAFYRDVARWGAEQGTLVLWFLRVDGRAIAFAMGFEQCGVYYDLKVGFHPGWSRFGPGVLLMEARIRHAFDSGLRGFEFLGGQARHKLDWTGTCHDRVRLQAFGRGPGGKLSRLAWVYGRPVAKRALTLIAPAPRGRRAT
jgi:CelD/BcsL family acetyltransferase involved in cellulose biosynthesis